jgi:cation transport ATPase
VRPAPAGKPPWVTRSVGADAILDTARREGESHGETVVFVSVDGDVCGAVAVSDAVKDSAAGAVAALHREPSMRRHRLVEMEQMVFGEIPSAQRRGVR